MPPWPRFPNRSIPGTCRPSPKRSCARRTAGSATRSHCSGLLCWNCSSRNADRRAIGRRVTGCRLILPSRDSIQFPMTGQLLGRSVNRLEDDRFVRGRGRYVADLVAPNTLHGVVIRSPHAHARIVALNGDAARKMPGVVAVLTGQDVAADNLGPLPCAVTAIPMTTPLVVPPCYALARDIVRYVGEPVAFVVADSAGTARDAAEAIVV